MEASKDRENVSWINKQMDNVKDKMGNVKDTLSDSLGLDKPKSSQQGQKSDNNVSKSKSFGGKSEERGSKDIKERVSKSSGDSNWMDKLKNKDLWRTSAYINGEFISTSRETFDVKNPADGSVLASLPRMTADDVEHACEVACKAFKKWKKTTGLERSQYLRKMADLMAENIDDLALIMTMEAGKPLEESKAEIEYAKSFYEWFAEEAKRFNGEVLQPPSKGTRLLTIKQPVGVCGLLAPWNFPSAMVTRKVGPALAAGCTAVIKPSSQTPMSALALCAIAEMAELPAGVINCLTVYGEDTEEVGKALCRSEIIRKISFTGSVETGKELMRECASTVKRISLELGGNAPFIVFDDADIDCAVDALLKCKFRNAGQVCIAADRVYIQSGIYEEFCNKFVDKVKSDVVVGRGTDPRATIGPLINKSAFEKSKKHVDDAIDKGARLLLGGKAPEECEEGCLFYEPTILADVTPDMLAVAEETFGPVCPLMSFKTEEEAIEMANSTKVGLSAYAFTNDLSRAFRVCEQLDVGMVGLNVDEVSSYIAPFGGVKESGLGREAGHEGLDEYLEVKHISMGVKEEACT